MRQGRDPASSGSKKRSDGADAPIAGALRSAYEETIREDVPSEFLDLLGKLK